MYNKTFGNYVGNKLIANNVTLKKKESLIPFTLLLSYLLLEYGRPQDMLPFLKVLHLPAITIVLLALAIIISGNIQLKDKQTSLIILLLGLMVVHGPIAMNNYWTLMIFIAMVMNFIVFLSLIQYVNNPERYDRLLGIWLGIHVFLSIIGIMKKGRGIGGFLDDENDFCMTLNMIIPLSFFLAFNASGKKRIYYILLTCLFLFLIILTESRGGFVGLVATSLYCWLRTRRKFITAIVIVFLAIFVVLVAPSKYWGEVRSITEEGSSQGTGEERIYTWNIGWHMFLDNPIMGVGQGNFPYVFKKYELEVTDSDEPFHGRSVAGREAHSIYITLLAELGLLGTILFLGLLYTSFKDLKCIRAMYNNLIKTNRNSKPNRNGSGLKYYNISMALEGSLISYLVSGAFISILYYPNFWILIGFIISLRRVVKNSDMELNHKTQTN